MASPDGSLGFFNLPTPSYYERNKAKCLAAAKQYQESHPDKHRASIKAYKERHPEKIKLAKLLGRLRKFGITFEEYSAQLARQNNACPICEQPFTQTPAIDHCHLTGEFRGFLCKPCNYGLGVFHDNPAALIKAAQYLTSHQ